MWTLSWLETCLLTSHLSTFSSLVLKQLFDEKIKDCKEDESRKVSTSSALSQLSAPLVLLSLDPWQNTKCYLEAVTAV